MATTYVKISKGNLSFIAEYETDDPDYVLDSTIINNKLSYSVSHSTKEEHENQFVNMTQAQKDEIEIFISEWHNLYTKQL